MCHLPYPPGTIHAIFEKGNNHYTWKKVTTTVHNIIVGKLWIDQVSHCKQLKVQVFRVWGHSLHGSPHIAYVRTEWNLLKFR